MSRRAPDERWEASVGFIPNKVTVYENPEKKGTLYLRWRVGGNWRKRSLGLLLRDARGRIIPQVRAAAEREAQAQYEILSGRRHVAAEAAPLAIGDTWVVVSDPKTGLYPTDTPHRREVRKAIADTARIWGTSTPWNVVDRARLRMLGRTRIDEIRAAKDTEGRELHGGYRGAEITLARILAVAAWLRDESKIAADACLPPRRWRDDLRTYWTELAGRTPEPARPRYTLEQMRKLLEVAGQVDPRFELLMALGAELRLGQVARARRSDVSTAARAFTVHARGKKRGTVVHLTGGQWAAWERATGDGGYLSRLEAAHLAGTLADYPLFPAGQMPGGRSQAGVATVERHGAAPPVDRTTLRSWFLDAETAAEIPHLKGRGWRGVRRQAVDEAKRQGISREGLMQHGGWTDTQVPDAIYADQEAEYSRAEARDIRAKIRGETA